MKVVKFDNESTSGLAESCGLSEIWLEIDERGHVLREIGFAPDGSVKHRHPGDGPLADMACSISTLSSRPHRPTCRLNFRVG